tara:strand:- start:457 stop:831 length:375 start_codon:yes stop_codon:yes gene_type:complete
MNPFDWVNSINSGKDIMVDDVSEQNYVPFVVNRAMSYFSDTILIANKANMIPHVDKKLQYHYLINSTKPRKRFSKWAKKSEDSDIELVMNAYNYSYRKAVTALSLLTRPQLETLKNKNNKGGIQ